MQLLTGKTIKGRLPKRLESGSLGDFKSDELDKAAARYNDLPADSPERRTLMAKYLSLLPKAVGRYGACASTGEWDFDRKARQYNETPQNSTKRAKQFGELQEMESWNEWD